MTNHQRITLLKLVLDPHLCDLQDEVNIWTVREYQVRGARKHLEFATYFLEILSQRVLELRFLNIFLIFYEERAISIASQALLIPL